jgi:hypothetical protein
MLKMENWVQLRYKCSPAEVFTEVRQGIEEDVTRINEIHKDNAEIKFSVVGKNGKFSVCRKGPLVSAGETNAMAFSLTCVDFTVTESGIAVKTAAGTSEQATLTLTNEAECKLRLKDGQELDSWQFRKRYLEDLFFNIYPNRQ